MNGTLRHRWGEPVRFVHKTERSCLRDGCEIVKVTQHAGEVPWIEFWRDGERLEVDKTPPCEGERSIKSDRACFAPGGGATPQ